MRILVSGFTAALVGIVAASAAATPIQIYGAWHCGSDFCTWASVRNMTEFDQKNHWLIDRGNGVPSVNVVNLSFVHPLRLLHHVNDAQTSDGVPIGMNQAVVDYFKNRSVRVMLSIGGITYTDAWNQALDEDPQGLAEAAAAAAQRLGVGIEIDYEENTNPRLDALQTFIDRYRALLPYDATGANAAARLTIDVAAGDRWLIALNRKATADWLNTSVQVLDYANAMVAARQLSASQTIANWQEHVDGKPQFSPPVLPLAPAKFTGSVYVAKGNRALPECVSFSGSLQSTTASFVQTVVPNVGATSGMLGYMFWAAECPGTRSLCTTPPNTCEGGVGVGATTLGIPIPMPPLRQN
jgi:hypothetical protein